MSKKKYTKRDLISFGNYLLSDKRKSLIKESGNKLFKVVQHSDLENWKEEISNNQPD